MRRKPVLHRSAALCYAIDIKKLSGRTPTICWFGKEAEKDNGLGIETICPFFALDYPLFITDLSAF